MSFAAHKKLGPVDQTLGGSGVQQILQWIHGDGSTPSGAYAFNVDDAAEVVVEWSYSIALSDAAVVPDALDISAAHLQIVHGTNSGRAAAGHRVANIDLNRNGQWTVPANEMTVSLVYPKIAGLVQPPIEISVTVGRGGRGYGRATFTVAAPPEGSPIAIPDYADGARLVSSSIPGGPVAFNQYASLNVGSIISSAAIAQVGDPTPIAQGAQFFDTTGAPAGSRIQFSLIG